VTRWLLKEIRSDADSLGTTQLIQFSKGHVADR
jgi:hypothetical protein